MTHAAGIYAILLTILFAAAGLVGTCALHHLSLGRTTTMVASAIFGISLLRETA